jgi:hypothetical protein
MNHDYKWLYKVFFAGAVLRWNDGSLCWYKWGEWYSPVPNFPLGDTMLRYILEPKP